MMTCFSKIFRIKVKTNTLTYKIHLKSIYLIHKRKEHLDTQRKGDKLNKELLDSFSIILFKLFLMFFQQELRTTIIN